MFVAQDAELGVPFSTARPRLMDLIAGSGLASVSRMAYGEGLARTGAGGLRGASQLMRVRSLEPAISVDRVTVGLRWEASGPPAGPFPVLDADITLTPGGSLGSRLALAGIYRVPSGRLHEDPGAGVTGRAADATVWVLLRAVAGYLSGSSSGEAPGSLPASADAP